MYASRNANSLTVGNRTHVKYFCTTRVEKSFDENKTEINTLINAPVVLATLLTFAIARFATPLDLQNILYCKKAIQVKLIFLR